MDDYDDYYSPRPRRQAPEGLIMKRRSDVLPGEIIVGRAPRPDQSLTLYSNRPADPYFDRQIAAFDDRQLSYDRQLSHDGPASPPPPYAARGRHAQRPRSHDGRDGYDSEGSIPPRSRRARSQDHQASRSQRARSSSPSSSDLGSTTDDERKIKKMRRKKYLTFGLTGIATIHAAGSIHKAMEMREQHKEEVAAGTMSEEEAHRKLKQQRWQEAGALGISALGIWQSMKEVKEARELHAEHRELMEKKEERHRRREERRRAGKLCRPNEGY